MINHYSILKHSAILIGHHVLLQGEVLVASLFSLATVQFHQNQKKRVTISLSAVEAQYRSVRRVCVELSWFSKLLSELHVSDITLIPLKCDNQVAIYITTNHVFHERTKTH